MRDVTASWYSSNPSLFLSVSLPHHDSHHRYGGYVEYFKVQAKRKHETTGERYSTCLKSIRLRFMKTLAGYSVATFLLGVRPFCVCYLYPTSCTLLDSTPCIVLFIILLFVILLFVILLLSFKTVVLMQAFIFLVTGGGSPQKKHDGTGRRHVLSH